MTVMQKIPNPCYYFLKPRHSSEFENHWEMSCPIPLILLPSNQFHTIIICFPPRKLHPPLITKHSIMPYFSNFPHTSIQNYRCSLYRKSAPSKQSCNLSEMIAAVIGSTVPIPSHFKTTIHTLDNFEY